MTPLRPMPPTVPVELSIQGDEPVRISLLGEDPRHTANALLTGPYDRQVVNLPPGRYRALIQAVEDNSQGFSEIEVLPAAGPQAFELDVRERFRPVQARPARPDSIFKSDGPSRWSFTVGLSMKQGTDGDAGPADPASWSAADNVEISLSPPGEPAGFELWRRYDWRENPRVRLTLDEAGAAAFRMPLPLFSEGVRCRIGQAADAGLAAVVQPIDPRKQLLLASLTRLFPDEQGQVLAQETGGGGDPIEMLAGKMEDPWAAAVAALVLVRNADIERVAQWVFNLRSLFPWLVDGAVAAAWTIAAVGEGEEAGVEREALGMLVSARRLGAPYFAASNRLALEMLSSLSVSAAEPETQKAATAEREIWARRARLAIKAGPFLAWRVSEDTGPLEPPGYRTVGKGLFDDETGAVSWM